MFRKTTKSLTELETFINKTIADLEENTPDASQSRRILVGTNMRIIAVLIGSDWKSKKKFKDDEANGVDAEGNPTCHVPKSKFLLNSLPDTGDLRKLFELHDIFTKKILPDLKIDNSTSGVGTFDPDSIGDLANVEKASAKELKDLIDSAFGKLLSKNDLLTIADVAKRLRKKRRLGAVAGGLLLAAAVVGGLFLINGKKDSEDSASSDWSDGDMGAGDIMVDGEDVVPEVVIDDEMPELAS